MKLYEVPNNTMIVIDSIELLFHHIDGAYSYCTDSDGCVHHVAAWAEVEIKSGD